VQCHPTGDGFTVHLPAFNEAANYLRDAAVTLTSVSTEAPGTPPDINGHSHIDADDDIHPSSAAALEHWSDDIPAHYFKIIPEPDRSSATSSDDRPPHPSIPHDLEGRRNE